jgi:hypothetical protein
MSPTLFHSSSFEPSIISSSSQTSYLLLPCLLSTSVFSYLLFLLSIRDSYLLFRAHKSRLGLLRCSILSQTVALYNIQELHLIKFTGSKNKGLEISRIQSKILDNLCTTGNILFLWQDILGKVCVNSALVLSQIFK